MVNLVSIELGQKSRLFALARPHYPLSFWLTMFILDINVMQLTISPICKHCDLVTYF